VTELDRVLTYDEAAAALGVCKMTLRRWISAGSGPPTIRLSAKKVGVRASDLRAFLDARTVMPGAAAPPCDQPR
jgi:excisionase family DNA binding protein